MTLCNTMLCLTRPISWIKMNGSRFMLLLFAIGCYTKTASGAYELLLSCGTSVASGGDCTMTCDTKDPSVTVIQWFNGTDSQTTIDKTVDCTVAGGLPYEASCNTPGKFDLRITNAQYGRDSYAWSCSSPFGGALSNATDGDTFVTVNLTRVTLTRTSPTSISCVAVSSPAATVTLYEGSPPSQDSVVKTETGYIKTPDGLETRLTSKVEESKTYYCHADNGVGPGVDSTSSSQVPETCPTLSTASTSASRRNDHWLSVTPVIVAVVCMLSN